MRRTRGDRMPGGPPRGASDPWVRDIDDAPGAWFGLGAKARSTRYGAGRRLKRKFAEGASRYDHQRRSEVAGSHDGRRARGSLPQRAGNWESARATKCVTRSSGRAASNSDAGTPRRWKRGHWRRKEEEDASKFKSLVSMYENMKAKDAAKVFDRLDMRILVEVVNAMNPRRMADILGLMSPEVAERLTVEIANRSGTLGRSPSGTPELPKIE
jgi:hypothetical protein